MRRPFSYFIRKYPSIRFFLLFLVSGLFLGGIIFFSSSTLYSNRITEVYPQVVRPGEKITVLGKHFGRSSINSWLMIGKNRIKPERCVEWTDTKIVFEAPNDIHEDILYVVVKSKPGNAVLLVNNEVLPQAFQAAAEENTPFIDSLETDSGNVGDIIAIHGKNFGHTRNTSVVLFTGAEHSVVTQQTGSGLPAGAECSEADFDYDFWSDRELRVRVPDAADSGSIVVITDSGMSNSVPFRLKNKYGSKKYTDTRTYRLVSEVEISGFIADVPNTFFLRIPLPQKTGAQRSVTIKSVNPDPFVLSYQGASLYRFHNVDQNKKIHIRQEYTVSRSQVKTDLKASMFKKPLKTNTLLYAAYTEPDELLPADDPVIQKLCKSIIKNESNPYNKAKRLYTFVTSEIRPKESNASDTGRSILAALEEKTGSAYDLALLFCTLSRAAGVPAIPTAGLLVDRNKNAVPHWWAEFYLDGFGWVPADPALAVGLPFDSGIADQQGWYFGNLDAYHIAFSRGSQNQAPMLSNGRSMQKVRSYAFRSIWEETTANIVGYSSLWRIPKITGVY
ncbi:MAG: transglutaminase domain-containing protein [Treponema sp.]